MTETSKSTFRPFALGQIVATSGALDAVSETYLAHCLARHARGDWGQVSVEDAATNDRATMEGCRLLSAYPIDPDQPCQGYGDNCLWVITKADQSVTTCLLPSEY